ncbi:Ig-like domain-containing protein [Synechococcus sp. H70.2]|uniref:Ig-like domain-containing protein n=1 Tax=unclassified Synechococcus TaxID=2626047 RepID=UPI0039C4BEC2
MSTPSAENLARRWRRWRTWVGLVVLAAGFWLVQPHPQVEPQPNPPLQWVSSQPAPEQQDVFVDGILRLQFNRPLDPNLQRLVVQLEPPAAVVFDVQGNELLLKPREPLRFSTNYTLTLAPQEGLPLEQTIQLRFRTEPQYTYERDIKPLLEASCVGCHQPAGRQRTQLLDSYEAVLAYVKPGDPNSELIAPRWTRRHATILNANNPNRPQARGGSPEIAYIQARGLPLSRLGFWTPEEVEIVRTWIVQDGAPRTSARAQAGP